MSTFDVEAATIYLVTHGSRAYGTNIETSDTDVKGVCVPPMKYLLGYAYNFEQQVRHEPDEVIYGVQKFFKLASDCNPNIIEILFVDPKHHRKVTPAGQLMLDNRDLFLSKKARFTFAGYAHAQLKRIKGHRAWLLNPPKAKPSRADYGLSEGQRSIGKQELGVINALQKDGYDFTDAAEVVLTKEKKYGAALTHWNQYQHWKKTRNPKRSALEAEFGYDTKHAMHLIRLMRMCTEILNNEGVKVYRPDREELIGIRRGWWSYDQIITEAERLDALAAQLYITSTLRKSPDVAALNDLCIRVTHKSQSLWKRLVGSMRP